MKYLIVESIANRPHLEVSGELALTLKSQGHDVSFCWLGDSIGWSEWNLSLFHKLLGCSFKNRVNDFIKIIAENGVEIIKAPKVNSAKNAEIIKWASQNIASQKELKELTFHKATLGLGVASSIISVLRDSGYNPASDKKRVAAALESAAIIYSLTKKIIKATNPDKLITFNGRFATARPIVQAGLQAGIEVSRHERGSSFNKYDLYQDTLHDFNYIASRIKQYWHNADKKKRESIAIEFYEKKRAGIPVAYSPIGDKTYLDAQEKGFFPPKITGKKRVVFFNSSDDEFAAISDKKVTKTWEDQHKAVKALITASNSLQDIDLVIRLHPNLANKSAKDKSKWYIYEKENLTMVKDTDKVDTYALIDSADMVVIYGSTVGMEAAYSNIPVMLLGCENTCTYADVLNIYKPKNKQEIMKILQMPKWQSVSKAHTYPYAYYYYTHGIDYKFYQPKSIAEGEFMGHELPWESRLFKLIRKWK